MIQYCSFAIVLRFTAFKQTHNRLGFKVAILVVRTLFNVVLNPPSLAYRFTCVELTPIFHIRVFVSDSDANELIGCVIVLFHFHYYYLELLVSCEHNV